MIIKYKIIRTVPAEHQVLVRFYSDTVPESELVSAWQPDGVTPAAYRTDYMITLPIPMPSDLQGYIMQFCPVGWFELKEQIANPAVDTSMADIVVGVENTVALP